MNNYTRNYFVTAQDASTGEMRYYFRIKGKMVEVDYHTYRACMNDYKAELYEYHKRTEQPIASLDYVDQDGHSLHDFVASNRNTETEAIQNVLIESVKNEINKMDPLDKEILIQYFFLQCSQPEIAQNIGISQQNVSVRLRKSIDKLKRKFGVKKI